MEKQLAAMPNSILYGNGLNRMSTDDPQWEELLKSVCKEGTSPLDNTVPNAMKCEEIYLADKADPVGTNRLLSKSDLFKVKKKIADASKLVTGNVYYDRLAHLDVVEYMTTNCDAALNHMLEKYGMQIKDFNSEEILYSTCRHCTYGEPLKRIWNLHGFAKSPSSIMVGLDQYWGSVAKLQNIQDNEKPILKRLERGKHQVYCWADLFYVSNVHIVGFSMNYAETDIWWVLSERMRRMKENPGLIQNEIHFYYIQEGKESRSFEMLLKSMGVTVHKYRLNKHLRKNVRWVRLYDQIFADLEDSIGTQEFEIPEISPMF